MEPLMPSEVARLVYGYLKEEKNDDTAECFLKSSPHLTECYQSFKANRKFNTKVNGFTLHGVFDIFGTMCSMSNVLVLIKERISDKFEFKTLLEKLQCLLDENHASTQENKCESFEIPKETYYIPEGNDLNTLTFEKALDSTPCDLQLRNTLDDFLVFDVDNAENDENACTNDQLNDSIKSRLRRARNKDGCIDDIPCNIKKNIFNTPKPVVYSNEDCTKVDNNIVLIHEESSDSYKFDPTRETIEPAPDRLIFPKRRKQSLESPSINSKFKKTNLTKKPLVQTSKSTINEVPNQNSFENQERNHVEINDIIKLPEVSSKTDDVTIIHDTPDDILKPPKNKSMSTPRRRSTHIRCLDFCTPQPKNMTRNKARSKLFYGTKNRLEKCLEEHLPNPLPKLEADFGSGNGFESMIKKDVMTSKKHTNSDIREMVGADILTSDADGRKKRIKKIPRKKTKSIHVQNKSIDLLKDQEKSSNNLITTNELHTNVSHISQNPHDVLTEKDSNKPLLDCQKTIKEQTKIPIQIIQEQSYVILNEEKLNKNILINSLNLKTVPDVPNKEKDPNFSKMFNNHSYSLIENNSNELTKQLKEQRLIDKKDINNSSELNSPIKCISTDPVKPKLFETPYKYDDAVDVPETPISKLIREYDPSKLVTPLPCTPEHYDNSLTETPLTKVFRETSYLNRPPISPFPPTPGNSMSVDTLFIPQKQDYIKTSNNSTVKMNDWKEFFTQPILTTTTDNKSSTYKNQEKVECTPLKSKVKLSTNSKLKNECKRKSIGAKQKQVYESVKIELFGTEISMNSNSKELFNTKEQHKTIVINPKPQENEKKSGFKPIPKRKSFENKYVVNVNGIENNLSNEFNMQPTKTIKPISVQHEDNNDYNSEKIKKKVSKTIKNSMIHFDDPEEKFFRLSNSPTPDKSNNENTGKIQNKSTINDHSEQFIGFCRYLNKTPLKMFDSSPKSKKIKTIEPGVKTHNLKNSDSNINYTEMYNVDKSSKSISAGCISSHTITNEMHSQRITFTENCTVDKNKVSNGNENNTVHNKSIELLESVQTMSSDDNISNPNSFSKNKINISLDRSESSIINYNNIVNNTSCITITHNDTLDVQISNGCDSLNNMEYLKISKVYEVITKDDECEMVYLIVSEKFTCLNIPSELNDVQPSDPSTLPLITRHKALEFTPEIKSDELVNNEETLQSMTSTLKDYVETKDDKVNRARRSPSLWNDSVHNYPTKHRGDRPREIRHRQNKINHKYDMKKYRTNSSRYHDDRPQFYTRNYYQRSHYHGKREFYEDSVYDKYRNKHKDKKRHSNRDYSERGNWPEEYERYPTQKRISQNDFQRLNRSENIAKKPTKRLADRTVYNQTPAKVSKVEHQLLLKNVNVDDFLSVVHGQK